jgi:tetratricopeptide (TPR) repeat protein
VKVRQIGWHNGLGAGVICVLLGGFAAGSAAADSAPNAVEHARRLFTEARDLEQSSRWLQAAAKLDQALGIKETPGLRFHLAYCQEQSGQLVEAFANYQRAAALLADGREAPDVARLLEPAQRSVDQRLPRVTLAANRGVAGTTLNVARLPDVPARDRAHRGSSDHGRDQARTGSCSAAHSFTDPCPV